MTTVESPALARDQHTRTNPGWQIQAELMKIRTTRLWWVLLTGVLAVTAVALLRNGVSHHFELYPPLDQYPPGERAGVVAQAAQARSYAGHAAIAADMVTSGQFFGVLLAMLLGVLVVTNEYAHQTATATFLTNPHRGTVIAAKLAASVAAGILFWAASTVLDIVVTSFYVRSQNFNVNLFDAVPLRSMLLSLLAYGMWAIFGVGLGSLFRSQISAVVAGMLTYLGGAAAVLVVFHLVYLIYPQTWVLGAPVIAPAVASLVMITPGSAFDHAPAQWVGLVIMIGYAVLLGTVGVLRTRRRDV
jgi:ABC-type transport system involved in multi-copper enzyme maturation permease subunit